MEILTNDQARPDAESQVALVEVNADSAVILIHEAVPVVRGIGLSSRRSLGRRPRGQGAFA